MTPTGVAYAPDDLGGTLVPIVTYRREADNKPVATTVTLAELVVRLRRHDIRAAKDGPAWSPVTYKPGTKRAKANVDQVHALVLDVDHVELPYAQLAGLAWVAHTTHSHNPPGDPRWRVVIPLSHSVPGDEQSWSVYWLRARERFGEAMDEACKDASRLYFWPACRPGAPHRTEIGEGDLLDPDSLPEVRASESTRPVAPRRTWSGDIKAYARKALEDEVALVAAAPPGERNRQLNKSGFALGQLVAGGELPRGLVEQELLTAAERSGVVNDDGVRATEKTLASGLNSGERSPRSAPTAPPPLSVPPRTNGKTHHADVVDATPVARHDQDAPQGHGETPPPEPPEESTQTSVARPDYHLTDLGNAQRLVASHGDDLRYAHQLNRWFVWDDMRWADDATAEVERRAKRTVRAMYALAAGEDVDEDKAKALIKHALRSESHKAIGAMVALSKSEPGVPVMVDDLDRNPWLLNVQNGTLDLRTGELRPHRREDLLTKLAPVTYDANAGCPLWLAFLDRIMDRNQDLIRFLQRSIGYTLTGSARERVLFMLHGGGANGKSTLLETMAALLGDYGKSTRAETLLVKHYDGGIPNDLAALKGARFVSTSETEEGKRMAEALVKALTGGDTLSARFLRGEFFTFRATFKLWLATNHKPIIRGSDPAIWDRIKLVPFDVRIPDAEQDKELPAKLLAELPGILAWAVRGCLEWQTTHSLGIPTEVRVATANYRADMDTVAAFVDDCCVVGANLTVEAGQLYEAYKDWCTASGEKFMSKKALGQRLLERPQFQPTRVGKKGTRGWKGVGLGSEPQQTGLEADAFRASEPDADAFSEMADATDANPALE